MKLVLRLCRFVMSILCETELGVVISHKTFINKVYEGVYNEEGKECSLCINSSLFNISSPFVKSKGKSRKRGHHSLASESSVLLREEGHLVVTACYDDSFHFIPDLVEKRENGWTYKIKKVQSSLPIILAEAQKLGYLAEYISSSQEFKRNEEARKTADHFYQESLTWQGKFFHGGNNSDRAIIKCIGNENYVIPAHCAFYSYNALDIVKRLDILKNKFDLVLLDPPWWNKYIRRKKAKCAEGSYQMMYNEDLKKIPIESLLVPDSLIAVWCTNSPTHLNTLIDDIFPSWGVKYIAKWFWVKVTQLGEPVCSFSDPPGKQPFEQIIFGCNLKGSRKYPLPEDGKLIVSVPSAIHSHKPPLSEVLSPYLGPEPQCLEVFARYLLPNWTSWGYEVLKLQRMSLYCPSSEQDDDSQ